MDAKTREEAYRRRRISARADDRSPHRWDPEAYEKDPVIFAIHHLFVLTDTERRIKTDLNTGEAGSRPRRSISALIVVQLPPTVNTADHLAHIHIIASVRAAGIDLTVVSPKAWPDDLTPLEDMPTARIADPEAVTAEAPLPIAASRAGQIVKLVLDATKAHAQPLLDYTADTFKKEQRDLRKGATRATLVSFGMDTDSWRTASDVEWTAHNVFYFDRDDAAAEPLKYLAHLRSHKIHAIGRVALFHMVLMQLTGEYDVPIVDAWKGSIAITPDVREELRQRAREYDAERPGTAEAASVVDALPERYGPIRSHHLEGAKTDMTAARFAETHPATPEGWIAYCIARAYLLRARERLKAATPFDPTADHTDKLASSGKNGIYSFYHTPTEIDGYAPDDTWDLMLRIGRPTHFAAPFTHTVL